MRWSITSLGPARVLRFAESRERLGAMTEPLKVGLMARAGFAQHLPGYQLDPDRVRLGAVCDIREDAAQAIRLRRRR